MRRISFVSSSLALGLLLAAASPPAAHAQRESRGKTYTVMTYNIGGKPGFTGYALDNGSSCEERSRQIGQHILDMPAADQPDILVFAEATGDCYKEGLVKTLNEHGPYKAFVSEFLGGSAQLQDSGLMFFSKFPWQEGDVAGPCPKVELVDGEINFDGRPADDHVGRRLSDLAPGTAAPIEAQLAHVLADGVPRLQFEVRGATGVVPDEPRVFEACAYPVVVDGGDQGLSAASFTPSAVFAPGMAGVLAFAFAAFMGFESTALYRPEARNPERTIPRATYGAVIFMMTFYCLVVWAINEGREAARECDRFLMGKTYLP